MASNERENMKTCSKCKVEKETVEFYKDKSRKGGLSYICKICSSAKSSKYNSSEHGKRYWRGWYRKNAKGPRENVALFFCAWLFRSL